MLRNNRYIWELITGYHNFLMIIMLLYRILSIFIIGCATEYTLQCYKILRFNLLFYFMKYIAFNTSLRIIPE